jgi:hypothetical protein
MADKKDLSQPTRIRIGLKENNLEMNSCCLNTLKICIFEYIQNETMPNNVDIFKDKTFNLQ